MKPKIFLRKLLKGGNNIEEVFKMDTLTISEKEIDNTYISKIDLSSDSFTFNEAYLNTYYLHLSIFCYYYIKQTKQDTDRAQFITDSVYKIKDYVKFYVLYNILKEIIQPSSSDVKKEKLINAIKSTDTFDDFDYKNIQVSKDAKPFENMKKLLNAIAIIIKYTDNNTSLISVLKGFCDNFGGFLDDNTKKLQNLNEYLEKAQLAKGSYVKTSNSMNKKMEIFEEIKKEVESKLKEYKETFSKTMKAKDEYNLISQAKIAKVKKMAVQVIDAVIQKFSNFTTSRQISRIIKEAINAQEINQVGKPEIDTLISEFDLLSDDEKLNNAMTIIKALIDNRDDNSSLSFSNYYYEEYLKEKYLDNSQLVIGGKKRKIKKSKKGGVLSDALEIVKNFNYIIRILESVVSSKAPVLIQSDDAGKLQELQKQLEDFTAANLGLTTTNAKDIQDLNTLNDIKLKIGSLLSFYEAYIEYDKKKQQREIPNIIPKINELLPLMRMMESKVPLLGKVPLLDVGNEAVDTRFQIVEDEPTNNLKQKIDTIENPHDDLIKAIKTSSDTKDLVTKETLQNAKFDAIIRILDGGEVVNTPSDLNIDNIRKMNNTIKLYDQIDDFLTTDIDGIVEDLKSLAANIKTVSIIFKQLQLESIYQTVLGDSIDDKTLLELQTQIKDALNKEKTTYDITTNQKLKEKLNSFEEVINKANSIAEIAKGIIENHKTGGFKKLFYKKKRGGAIDNDEVKKLDESYQQYNKTIIDNISELTDDISLTESNIQKYNTNSDLLSSLDSDIEPKKKSLQESLTNANMAKDEAIAKAEREANSVIEELTRKISDLDANSSKQKTDLQLENERLIADIKKKLIAIENLKASTRRIMDSAKELLEEKGKLIEKIVTEKNKQIEEITAAISSNKEKETEVTENLTAMKSKVEALEDELKGLSQNRDIFQTEKSKNDAELDNIKSEYEQFQLTLNKTKEDILANFKSDDLKQKTTQELHDELLKSASDIEEPKSEDVRQETSYQQKKYNRDLLEKFLGINRFIKRNTDDDFKREVDFLLKFGDDSLSLAGVNALIQQFKSDSSMYGYPENEQLRSLLAIAHQNYNKNTLTNISSISPEKHKGNNIILGRNGKLVTVTVDGDTLTFIKIDNQIRYVKFGNGNNVFLKLDPFDFYFVFDDNDSNKSNDTIVLEKPPSYDEGKDYKSADKYYMLYKKYFKSNDFGLDIENTDFIEFIKKLLTQTTLKSINSSIRTEKDKKSADYLRLFGKLGFLIWIEDGRNATNLSDSTNTLRVDYDSIYYRKTQFLINKADNKVIGIKLSTEDNNKIYLLFPDPFISKLNLKYFQNDMNMIGGAPNTDKPNNIFNAYIIMVMNKIMEMNEAGLKDFTTKAMIVQV